MAKKKEQKPESLHDMSVPELKARLGEIQENQFRLQFRHAGNPLKNPMEIRTARRQVARIKTILRQKQEVA